MECNISPIQEDSSKGSAIQESVIIAVDDGPVLEVLLWLVRTCKLTSPYEP